MKFNGIAVIIYGLLIILGGVIGFAKAHSIASITMGTLFGAGLLASGIAMLKKSNIGFYSATALSSLLTIFFTYRFILTQRLMPAGIMSLLSLIVLIALYLGGSAKQTGKSN